MQTRLGHSRRRRRRQKSGRRRIRRQMASRISRCGICGQFFDSIKQLKAHKDKDHRITTVNVRK